MIAYNLMMKTAQITSFIVVFSLLPKVRICFVLLIQFYYDLLCHCLSFVYTQQYHEMMMIFFVFFFIATH